ncbi:MAG TPA: 2-C-methyl-D-erythritol 4-phosphate cytidylyltransferase [Lachnospiraceae bacterium]|nr:2-C-methyl-D-erythritol 4-phosphate cytidylyltransferase [Lachnospiraceae bacterium]
MNIAMIIAGGSGNRMHQDIPKQFLTVNEKPVIIYTLEVFQKHPAIDEIVVVCIEGWEQVLWAYVRQFNLTKVVSIVKGGDCGQNSIYRGLKEIEKNHGQEDIVLIHDAIRPLVSEEIISDCISKTVEYGSAIACIPCAEAMLVSENQEDSNQIFNRDYLKRTQTPQGFRFGKLMDIHKKALEQGITDSTASCTLMIEMGENVHFSKGSEKNLKLTTVEDIDIFKALLLAKRAEWMKT